MRRIPVAFIPLGVSIFIAACAGERDTTAPSAIAPSQAASALTLPSACSKNIMSTDARAFFDRSTDVAFDYITNLFKAAEPQRTAIGWQIINEISTARLTSRQETPWASTAAAGERLATDVFVCIQGIGDVSTINDGTLASAILNGIFEVRGGGFATGPAFGYLVVDNAKALSAPRYGVENRPANTQWAGNPFLIVGVPTQYGPTFVPYAGNINTNGTPVNGFDLFSIPLNQSKANKVIGVCIPAVPSGTGTANMLIHAGAIQDQISPNQICDTQFGALPSSSWFASLAHRAASFFTPALAHAQLLGDDYSGGGPTSWSPNVVGSVEAGSVALAFTAQSTLNTFIDSLVHFEVTATINSQPVPDVVVNISIYGNNGTPGSINGPTQATTNGAGIASFDVSFTKAGGYVLQATGSLGGLPTQSALSQQFWVKNQ
jgi:hypothetical protein